VLKAAVAVAQGWLAGTATLRQLEEAAERGETAAVAVAGSRFTPVIGPGATAWSAVYAIEAAVRAARIGEQPEEGEDDAEDAAVNAMFAAHLIRRAVAEGHEQAALRFQFEVVRTLWPA
jgi:hypothetical protein